MADYYSILNKTISGLVNNSQATRTAVYGKARTAIERQLRAIEPTPSDAAIARQMDLLEVAIDKIDQEYSQPAEVSPQSEPTAAPPPPIAPVAPVVNEGPDIAVEPAQYVPSGNITATPAGVNPVPAQTVEPVSDPRGMEYTDTILAVEPDTSGVKKSADRKNGIFSMLLPILLAIGVIGGGSYALWINKDALLKGLMGDDKPSAVENSQESNITPSSDTTTDEGEEPRNVRVVGDAQEKNSDQLTEAGETVEVAPEEVEQTPDELTPVVETPTQEATTPLTPQTDTGEQQVTEIGEDGKPADATSDEAATDANATQDTAVASNDTTPASVTPAVAQKAFLYEEGNSGTDASRDNAAVIWSLAEESIDGGAPEAVIKGQLDVPGRSITMNLVIKRNRDDSLPASHIIELNFELPGDFSGGNIANVSRFVMKSSEQARGEGLVAVPAKISDGNFLIALNNLEQALATNRKLLLESSWIDVPLGYTTGRRALVTLEKGALGNKVFKDAFADWDKR